MQTTIVLHFFHLQAGTLKLETVRSMKCFYFIHFLNWQSFQCFDLLVDFSVSPQPSIDKSY